MMPYRVLYLGPLALALFLAVSVKAETSKPTLARSYTGGEKLTYRMKGVNENWRYEIEANGIVRKDSGGAYVEEYRWSNFVSDGRKTELSPLGASFTQVLSLDPQRPPSAPDLSKSDLRIVGPITDLLTCYADYWLAIRLGKLNRVGDHFYFKRGTPASWADGQYVLIGEDSIDFDFSLTSMEASTQAATLLVRHVVPEKPQVKLVADWMQRPVSDTPNNWIQVQKIKNGRFSAAIGKETFDVEIKVSLRDGKILAAKIDNAVTSVERECDDAALSACGEVKPHRIVRHVELVLVQ